MSHQRVLLWVVLMMGAAGLMDGPAAGGGAAGDAADMHLLVALAVSYLCFLWYRSDSDARGYRRSRWLSVGVAAAAFCAIPYYLLRSRADAERGTALLTYAAYLVVIAFAVWVGIAVHIGLA